MIGRSTTGTYHHVAGSSSACNGRSFRGSTIATADLIDRAHEEMFCKKCFNINARDKTRKNNAIFVFNQETAA